MNREPFSLEEWKKDPSRKVVTESLEPVKIVFTDGMGNWPVLAVIYDGDTTDSAWYTRDGLDIRGDKGLFIITDEPEELTEFEKEVQVASFLEIHPSDTDAIKAQAEHLLELAQKELENSDWIKDIREWCHNKGHLEGYAKGQEDAEKRHKETTSFHFPMYGSFVPPCYLGGPCTNPHHDCINCPHTGTSGIAKTDTNIK